MEILSDPTPDMLAMPRFDDGAIDMQELLRRLAEQVVNAVMDAEADQLCGGGANSRNGQHERSLTICAGVPRGWVLLAQFEEFLELFFNTISNIVMHKCRLP